MKSVCDPVSVWQQIQNKMRVGFGWLATRATDGIAMLLLFLLFSSSSLHAQGLIYDESDQWQEGSTAELWQCNLRDNANFTALKGVIDSWNAYADAAGWSDYSAKLLTPIFASDVDLDTTVYWYGKWSESGGGSDIDALLKSGGEISSQFQPVLACSSRILFGGWDVRAELDSDSLDSSIITMADCEYVSDWDNQRGLLKTKGDDDLAAANRQLNGFLDKTEARYNITQLWPWMGRSKDTLNENWDIKWMEEYTSAEHLVQSELSAAKNGIFTLESNVLDPVVDCKDPEVFSALTIRTQQ